MKFCPKAISLVLLAASAMTAGAQKIDDLTRAVLNSYQEMLAENPKDYETLFERAALYVRMGNLDDALTDLQQALACTPGKDTAMKGREWSLLATVYQDKGDAAKALEAIDNALAIDPSSYNDLYTRGNLLMELKRPDEAYRTYSRMQQFKSRSQEAYFGMAKAAIALGNTGEALDLIKEAEKAAPNSALTYSRLGDVYIELGDPAGAANAYMNAFLLADDQEVRRPFQALRKLSQTNFKDVADVLDIAIAKNVNTPPLLYLKGILAYESRHFDESYNAYKALLAYPSAQEGGIYTSFARSAMMTGNNADAAQALAQALDKEPSAETYMLLAQTRLADKKYDEALEAARKAASLDIVSPEPLVMQALAIVGKGTYEEALIPLNEAVMVFGDNPVPLLVRGWLYNSKLGRPENAKADFARVGRIDTPDFYSLFLQSLGRSAAGESLLADKAVQEELIKNPTNMNLEYAVAYYTYTGNLAALNELRKSAGDRAVYNTANPEFFWLTEMMK